MTEVSLTTSDAYFRRRDPRGIKKMQFPEPDLASQTQPKGVTEKALPTDFAQHEARGVNENLLQTPEISRNKIGSFRLVPHKKSKTQTEIPESKVAQIRKSFTENIHVPKNHADKKQLAKRLRHEEALSKEMVGPSKFLAAELLPYYQRKLSIQSTTDLTSLEGGPEQQSQGEEEITESADGDASQEDSDEKNYVFVPTTSEVAREKAGFKSPDEHQAVPSSVKAERGHLVHPPSASEKAKSVQVLTPPPQKVTSPSSPPFKKRFFVVPKTKTRRAQDTCPPNSFIETPGELQETQGGKRKTETAKTEIADNSASEHDSCPPPLSPGPTPTFGKSAVEFTSSLDSAMPSCPAIFGGKELEAEVLSPFSFGKSQKEEQGTTVRPSGRHVKKLQNQARTGLPPLPKSNSYRNLPSSKLYHLDHGTPRKGSRLLSLMTLLKTKEVGSSRDHTQDQRKLRKEGVEEKKHGGRPLPPSSPHPRPAPSTRKSLSSSLEGVLFEKGSGAMGCRSTTPWCPPSALLECMKDLVLRNIAKNRRIEVDKRQAPEIHSNEKKQWFSILPKFSTNKPKCRTMAFQEVAQRSQLFTVEQFLRDLAMKEYISLRSRERAQQMRQELTHLREREGEGEGDQGTTAMEGAGGVKPKRGSSSSGMGSLQSSASLFRARTSKTVDLGDLYRNLKSFVENMENIKASTISSRAQEKTKSQISERKTSDYILLETDQIRKSRKFKNNTFSVFTPDFLPNQRHNQRESELRISPISSRRKMKHALSLPLTLSPLEKDFESVRSSKEVNLYSGKCLKTGCKSEFDEKVEVEKRTDEAPKYASLDWPTSRVENRSNPYCHGPTTLDLQGEIQPNEQVEISEEAFVCIDEFHELKSNNGQENELFLPPPPPSLRALFRALQLLGDFFVALHMYKPQT